MTSPRSARGARRFVVVSPHLDDGVLSLGAAISSWARGGDRVEVLTVLACDPESTAPVGGWDRRGGFATEGESARARRDEDQEACALVGAVPVWLPFGSVDYERHGDERAVVAEVARVVEGADEVLLPGFPLTHPDHLWLTRALTAARLPCRALALYTEQPYTRREAREVVVPDWLETVDPGPAFVRMPVTFPDRLAKWRAIRRYRSQLPLLGMRRSLRRGAHVLALSEESIAWMDGEAGRGGN